MFQRASWLGSSLAQLPKTQQLKLILRDDNNGTNAAGLSEHYNNTIEHLLSRGAPLETILAFCHDDIYIHDWNLGYTLDLGLREFDLIGPIGCQQARKDQPGWASTLDQQGKHIFLSHSQIKPSGSINHCDYVRIIPEYFHPIGVRCALLDGCFLAVRLETFATHPSLRFDNQFRFHCYDTDLCRQALRLDLRIGSWPLLISHQSGGSFDNSWEEAAKCFQQKWAI
jgi:hypothetical protein